MCAKKAILLHLASFSIEECIENIKVFSVVPRSYNFSWKISEIYDLRNQYAVFLLEYYAIK